MYSESSPLVISFMPGGRFAFTRSTSAFTLSSTSTVFAVDCLMMPKPVVSWPFVRNIRYVSRDATTTFATSPSRTRWPSLPCEITRLRNWSAVS